MGGDGAEPTGADVWALLGQGDRASADGTAQGAVATEPPPPPVAKPCSDAVAAVDASPKDRALGPPPPPVAEPCVDAADAVDASPKEGSLERDLENILDNDMEMEDAADLADLDEAATLGVPPEGPPPLKRRRCDVCEEDLPESDFPQKSGKPSGNQCNEDFKALQSFQKQLKQAWGKEYTKKYNELRANRATWRQQVLAIRAAGSGGRGTCRMRADIERVAQTSYTGHRNSTFRRRRWMTYPAFQEWAKKPKGGSLNSQQCVNRWAELRDSPGMKKDFKGVIGAAGGQERLYIQIEEGGQSSDEEGERAEHILEGKGKKAGTLDEGVARDLLSGRVRLASDDTDPEIARIVAQFTGGASSSAAASAAASAPGGAPQEDGTASLAASTMVTGVASAASEASGDVAAGGRRRVQAGSDGGGDREAATPTSKNWDRQRERKVLNAVVAWQSDVARLKLEVVGTVDQISKAIPEEKDTPVDQSMERYVKLVQNRAKVLKMLLADTPESMAELAQQQEIARKDPSQSLVPGIERLFSIVGLEEKGKELESAANQLDLTAKNRELGTLRRAVSSILSDAKRAVSDYQAAIARRTARGEKEEAARSKQLQKTSRAVAKQAAASKAAPSPPVVLDFFATAATAARVIKKISVKAPVVTKSAIVEACAGASGINADLPAVIEMAEASTALAGDQEFKASFEAFKNDFKASCEKAARAQRARPGCTLGASALKAIADAVVDFPAFSMDGASVLPKLKESTSNPSQLQALERLFDPATVYMTGMARGSRYFGTDFGFLASVRWQLEGQREVVLLPVTAVEAHLKGQGLEQWTQVELASAIRGLHAEELHAFLSLGWRATLVDGDALYIPSGWMVAELSKGLKGAPVHGIRRTLLPGTPAAIQAAAKLPSKEWPTMATALVALEKLIPA